MAQYEVNNCSVSSLLVNIKDGSIAIPEIQRPFVWDATKVRDLIDSLYHGYPVGYIIIWQNPDVRLKDGTTSVGRKVIIDGQQRITALTAALVGQEVLGSDYRKKSITIAFNPMEEVFEVSNPAIKKNTVWIPDIAKLFVPGFSSFTFIMDYCAQNKIDDNATKAKLNDIITRLSQVQNNNLGIIDLSHELDIEQVTDIFIRAGKHSPMAFCTFTFYNSFMGTYIYQQTHRLEVIYDNRKNSTANQQGFGHEGVFLHPILRISSWCCPAFKKRRNSRRLQHRKYCL